MTTIVFVIIIVAKWGSIMELFGVENIDSETSVSSVLEI